MKITFLRLCNDFRISTTHQFSSYPLIKFLSPSWGQSYFDISLNLLSAISIRLLSACVKTQADESWLTAIFSFIFPQKFVFFFYFIMAAVGTSFYWTKRKIKTWKTGLRLVNRLIPLSLRFLLYTKWRNVANFAVFLLELVTEKSLHERKLVDHTGNALSTKYFRVNLKSLNVAR